jgi:regulator of sigma E protease
MTYVFFTNLVAVVIVLGVMILIHEFGHFIAARWFNVRVEVFSLGFGKRLFGVRRGGTDYRISLLPLGGYVKMAGENPGEQLTGDPGEFLGKPKWQRFVIAFMGPAMNIVLAIALLTGLYTFKYQKLAYQEEPARIGYIAKDSPAQAAGLQPGDLLVRVDDKVNPNWETVEITILSNPGQTLAVEAQRDGQLVNTAVTPQVTGKDRVGVAGWAPYIPAVVSKIEPGLPAASADIKPGDVITAINGERLTYEPRLPEAVQDLKGQPATLTIDRAGRTFSVTLTPVKSKVPEIGEMWRIGIDLKTNVIDRRLSLPNAFRHSVEANRKYALLIFDFLGKMLERKMSPRSMAGPIGIAQLSGEAARQGLADFISLMALISLNLGIFNLFPIPVLDGGVILLLAIEGIMRRDLSLQVKERIVQVGFVFLVLILVFAIYNDILKTLPAKFGGPLP